MIYVINLNPLCLLFLFGFLLLSILAGYIFIAAGAGGGGVRGKNKEERAWKRGKGQGVEGRGGVYEVGKRGKGKGEGHEGKKGKIVLD